MKAPAPLAQPGAQLKGDQVPRVVRIIVQCPANPAVPFQSCVVCFRGDTTTAMMFRGEAELVIAGFMRLGLPEEEVLFLASFCFRSAGSGSHD